MKILVADDNPTFCRILETILSGWGYDTVIAQDGFEALHILQNGESPRLAILDWMMPRMDGAEVCRKIRANRREPYVYILLLTAKTEQKDLVEGMEAGADDYITKQPFHVHELRVRLRAGRRILDLEAELIGAREALRDQATRDSLTRLWNRTAIFDILHRELARSQRESSATTVLMADLDAFKRINDTYGHVAGDAVLKEAARRMSLSVRSYDSIGRYGGEEFLIILPGTDLYSGAAQAERIRAAVASAPYDVGGGDLLHVTCSVGLTSSAAGEMVLSDSLIRQADAALYAAKEQGRNRVECCGAALSIA